MSSQRATWLTPFHLCCHDSWLGGIKHILGDDPWKLALNFLHAFPQAPFSFTYFALYLVAVINHSLENIWLCAEPRSPLSENPGDRRGRVLRNLSLVALRTLVIPILERVEVIHSKLAWSLWVVSPPELKARNVYYSCIEHFATLLRHCSEHFISFFPIWMLFISFYCLAVWRPPTVLQ